MKKADPSKKKPELSHHFSAKQVYGVFFRRSRADNSILCGPIRSKFELDIMHVLNTYKFIMDQINSNREKVATSIFRRSRAANSVVRGRVSVTKFSTHPSSYVCHHYLQV